MFWGIMTVLWFLIWITSMFGKNEDMTVVSVTICFLCGHNVPPREDVQREARKWWWVLTGRGENL